MDKMPGQAMQLGGTTLVSNPVTTVWELVEKIGWNYGVLWRQSWSDTASSPELQVVDDYCNMPTLWATRGCNWDGSEFLESNFLSTFRGFTLSRSLAQETLQTGQPWTSAHSVPAADQFNLEGNIETLLFIPNAPSGHVLELGSTQAVSEQSLPPVLKEGEEFLQLNTYFVGSLISDELDSSDSVGNSYNSVLELPPCTTTPSAFQACGNGMQQSCQPRTAGNFCNNHFLVNQALQEEWQNTSLGQAENHPQSPASVGTIHRGPLSSQPSPEAKPTHAQAEQKRRANHKKQMEVLKSILPCKKKDKASVLELAVKTIQEGKLQIDALRRENKKLEERARLHLRNDPNINFVEIL